jgi:hypothetical protein
MTTTVEHLNRRLLISLPSDYEDARIRYEKLVPAVDLAAFGACANWNEVLLEAKRQAPHGFLRYFRTDVATAMVGSGTKSQATQYLMGNHTIAERMYRHDPGVMLHAPLRTLLHDGPQGTVLAVDQPSMLFGSYGNPSIAAVGSELDTLLARLIELLGGEIPLALRAPR